MTLSLHAAFVPSCLQILRAQAALIDKAEAFCAERDIPPADILEARLAADMLPFAYQAKSTVVHSLGAIEGVRRGEFNPDQRALATGFDELRDLLAGGIAGLEAVDPAELDGYAAREVRFVAGGFRLDFTAANFLLSFSQPNFYFHATTAYDLLRWKGLAIGKRDFAGRPRITPPA